MYDTLIYDFLGAKLKPKNAATLTLRNGTIFDHKRSTMASWKDCLTGSGALGQSLQRSWMEDSTALCLGDSDLPLPKPIRSTTLAVNLLVSGECRLKRQAKKQE
jgi:hypothetical protein